MHKVYLSLGSNIGDRAATLWEAVRLVGERVGSVVRVSSLMETEAWGFSSENKFLNAAIQVITDKEPLEVLQLTEEIERTLGRTKKSVAGVYSDRPIDIDILLYDKLKIDTPRLTIPHPKMQEREFVMKPLSEVME